MFANDAVVTSWSSGHWLTIIGMFVSLLGTLVAIAAAAWRASTKQVVFNERTALILQHHDDRIERHERQIESMRH